MKSRPKIGDFKGVITGDQGDDLPMEARHEAYASHTSSKIKPSDLALGQRWYIETEPDLGIGTIDEIQNRRVSLSFHDGTHTRQYSIDTAPLHRVRFERGDTIETREGYTGIVEELTAKEGLLHYVTKDKTFSETELSGRVQPHTPLQMLLSGQSGDCAAFNLRCRAVEMLHLINGSPARGFAGAKIDLLAHQMYIASTVSSRYVRRILLADEVGLGKTIEACLILHRLMVTGQASRALILVPESLTHIWFVELLRKFNIVASILDNRHEGEVEREASTGNPFLHDSCIISSVEFLMSRKQIGERALDADWDILVLDEAHHLLAGTEGYAFVSQISKKCRDILFLTATPQQNGTESHFSRLQILDPFRYTDFAQFEKDALEHARLAGLLSGIQSGGEIDADASETLKRLVPWCAEDIDALAKSGRGKKSREQLIKRLLDHLGTGRAFFRNTRTKVGGFPGRHAVVKVLKGNSKTVADIRDEFNADREGRKRECSFSGDPRITYLADLLREDKKAKILLICSTTEKVEAIKAAVAKEIQVDVALFHEGLTLIQRDRNAAWFGEEGGARLLVCSEIGSEGRNFQFVNQLFMFDLPSDPELVDQRIGRLDRIGQKNDIEIHVPCVAGTPYEILAEWYHQGLGMFEAIVSGAHEIHLLMVNDIDTVISSQEKCSDSWRQELARLVANTKIIAQDVTNRMKEGRDQLLEMHSMIPHKADTVMNAVRREDSSSELEEFFLELFKSQGVFSELIGPRSYKLWGSGIEHEVFKGLTPSRPLITFDRGIGLHREDVGLVTIDHPAVHGGIDLLLSSIKGRHAFAIWESDGGRELILEALFILSSIAPPELQAERFLPPTPIRVAVTHHMKECHELIDSPVIQDSLREWGPLPAVSKPKVRQEMLPQMVAKAEAIARERSVALIRRALSSMKASVGAELDRMEALGSHSQFKGEDELTLVKNEFTRLDKELRAAKPRLDSLRLVLKTTVPKGS